MSLLSPILLIGGAGFIGAQLVPELLKRGRAVTVLGRRAVPEFALPAEATYQRGDFMDTALIGSLLEKHGEVVHLANATVPNTSSAEPLADLMQNLPPAVQLFAACAQQGARLLLLSSGGTVYGQALTLPMDERHPTRPISPYGVTKLTLENYANLYAATHGLRHVCVRPANAYGVGQRAFTGQGFVSTAVASAMRGLPIKIFGQHGAVRDYLYITDLVAGIADAIEHGVDGETYNIGSGIGLSNRDVTDMMGPLLGDLGVRMTVEHLPARIQDVRSNVLDASKLRAATGWRPSVGFEEGLRRTITSLKHLHV
ncbi:MAG: NAD-dependent epimerase/dehydratase family protein [Polaromonas sp.]|nr:NAD-dependent epimerase/dehydratase family protein [Polaromonas sp.]